MVTMSRSGSGLPKKITDRRRRYYIPLPPLPAQPTPLLDEIRQFRRKSDVSWAEI